MKILIKITCIITIVSLASCIVQAEKNNSLVETESSIDESSSSELETESSVVELESSVEIEGESSVVEPEISSEIEPESSSEDLSVSSSTQECPVLSVPLVECDEYSKPFDILDENKCFVGTKCFPVGPSVLSVRNKTFVGQDCSPIPIDVIQDGCEGCGEPGNITFKKKTVLYFFPGSDIGYEDRFSQKDDVVTFFGSDGTIKHMLTVKEKGKIIVDEWGTEYRDTQDPWEECDEPENDESTIDPDEFILKSCKQMESIFIRADMSVTEYRTLFNIYERKCGLDDGPTICTFREDVVF